MRFIDVSTKKFPGTFARVDDGDFDRLSKFKWSASKPQNVIYAIRPVVKDGKKTTVRMHCEILGAAFVDHRDGDGLNNQRLNLRPYVGAQNNHNTRHGWGVSRFKGVSWHKGECKWRATIVVEKKQKSLGYFKDEEEAARAYDRAAMQYFGEFAATNFEVENV